MFKKDKQKLGEFIRNHLHNITHVANVTHFRVFYSPSSSDDKDFKGNSPAIMTMDTSYEYLSATLRYDEKKLLVDYKNKYYNKIIAYICHEVSHILTGEPFDRLKIKYKGDGRYYQERLTETVGRMVEDRYMNQYIPHNKIKIKTGK